MKSVFPSVLCTLFSLAAVGAEIDQLETPLSAPVPRQQESRVEPSQAAAFVISRASCGRFLTYAGAASDDQSVRVARYRTNKVLVENGTIEWNEEIETHQFDKDGDLVYSAKRFYSSSARLGDLSPEISVKSYKAKETERGRLEVECTLGTCFKTREYRNVEVGAKEGVSPTEVGAAARQFWRVCSHSDAERISRALADLIKASGGVPSKY